MPTPLRVSLVALALALAVITLVACQLAGSHESFDRQAGLAAPMSPAASMATPPRDEARDTEGYDRLVENAFLTVGEHPLSTFAIDVDTASYSNVRRFLSDRRLPPPDAVRIEELVNYFDYEYPAPDGDTPFSAITEVGPCPWNPQHRLVHIGLQGRRLPDASLPPRNLVFLLDVSGSMNAPDKLPLLKSAFGLLVEQLTARDRIAIVVYAGASGLVLPSTPGDRGPQIRDALNRLGAGGSTNGGAGIRLAYQVAREAFVEGGINRVILATDGDFNVGTTSRGELLRLIEGQRQSGVFLTVLGFGTGNVKDSQMEQLADHGNGNYAYIDRLAEARKVLVHQAGATLVTIAKDVKIQVEFNPARVASYRLIGYENRLLADEDFNDDSKDAGEIGAGHSVTALYEIVPAGGSVAPGAVDPLRYQGARPRTEAASTGELMTLKLRFKAPSGDRSDLLKFPVTDAGASLAQTSRDFRFSAAVAAFGMQLRGSPHKGRTTYALIRELARDALGADAHGYRRGFMTMVDRAAEIGDGAADPK